MKKSDITPQMFEDWKAEMREVFKNDPNSMNLIAVGLRVIADESKTELHENWNKQLLQFFENELSRKNELVCEHCGNKLEIYYTAQCFHCLPCKPKIENHEGNYLCAVKWIKNQEPEFNEDVIWNYICNYDILRGNDTYMVLPEETQDEKYNENIKIFLKHYPEKNIKWFVSW
jgi:hypothetical protein